MRIIAKVLALAVIVAGAGLLSPAQIHAFPSFSLAPGPSAPPIPPGGVLEPFTGGPFPGPQPAPLVGLSAASLGVPAAGNIQDFSYGDENPFWALFGNPLFYQFSVDGAALGGPWLPPGPPDNLFTQGTVETDAGADVFTTLAAVPPFPVCGLGMDMLLYDGNGGTILAPAFPGIGGLVDPFPGLPLISDNVDGYEARPVAAVDFLTYLAPVPPLTTLPDGRPDAAIFFTVDPATAALMGVSAATVLVTDKSSPTGWAVYAGPAMLGLAPGDDIDALMVSDSLDVAPGPGGSVGARVFGAATPADVISFSLAPGSPSLALGPPLPAMCGPFKSPGDLWAVSPVYTGGVPVPLAAAEQMGLCSIRVGCPADDNLDAVGTAWAADIDNDGLPDGAEAGCGTIVGVADTDLDGLSDGIEASLGWLPAGPCTGGFPLPAIPDSDADGMFDGWEVTYFTPACPGAKTNPSLLDAAADPDGEGAANIIEMAQGTSPCVTDTDLDGFLDLQTTAHTGPANTVVATDNCPNVSNAAQTNTDGNFSDNSPPYVPAVDDKTIVNSDAPGDACDSDDDNDGLSDATEALPLPCATATGATSSVLLDTDGDRVTDGAECVMGSDPFLFASRPAIPPVALDPDLDRLSSAFEGVLGTNPLLSDTDGDGVPDGIEYKGHGSNPLVIDTDGDGVRDRCEVASLNGDTIVNSGDQTAIATEIVRVGLPPKLADFDVNKDTVLNSGDQTLIATGVGPGKCP